MTQQLQCLGQYLLMQGFPFVAYEREMLGMHNGKSAVHGKFPSHQKGNSKHTEPGMLPQFAGLLLLGRVQKYLLRV